MSEISNQVGPKAETPNITTIEKQKTTAEIAAERWGQTQVQPTTQEVEDKQEEFRGDGKSLVSEEQMKQNEELSNKADNAEAAAKYTLETYEKTLNNWLVGNLAGNETKEALLFLAKQGKSPEDLNKIHQQIIKLTTGQDAQIQNITPETAGLASAEIAKAIANSQVTPEQVAELKASIIGQVKETKTEQNKANENKEAKAAEDDSSFLSMLESIPVIGPALKSFIEGILGFFKGEAPSPDGGEPKAKDVQAEVKQAG